MGIIDGWKGMKNMGGFGFYECEKDVDFKNEVGIWVVEGGVIRYSVVLIMRMNFIL